MKINLKMLVISFALAASLISSGCHTLRGVGQDVQHGGQAIQNAAS